MKVKRPERPPDASVSRRLASVLFSAGFAFLIAYWIWGRSQESTVQASLLSAVFALGAGYSFLKFKFTTDRVPGGGHRSARPQTFYPHGWWMLVGVFSAAAAIVFIAQALNDPASV